MTETVSLLTLHLERHQRGSKGVKHPPGNNETLRSNPARQSQGKLASVSRISPLLIEEPDSVPEDDEVR